MNAVAKSQLTGRDWAEAGAAAKTPARAVAPVIAINVASRPRCGRTRMGLSSREEEAPARSEGRSRPLRRRTPATVLRPGQEKLDLRPGWDSAQRSQRVKYPSCHIGA